MKAYIVGRTAVGILISILALVSASTVMAAPLGDFEPNGSPKVLSAFGYSGGAGGKILQGGQSDPEFGKAPAATEGKHVYGFEWKDPEQDNTVELKCEFAEPGFDLTGVKTVELDVYVPAGTNPSVAVGIFFTDQKTWIPQTVSAGANDKWVTMSVDVSQLGSVKVKELNFGFKNVSGPGKLFLDNFRVGNGPVGGKAATGVAGAQPVAPSGARENVEETPRPLPGSGATPARQVTWINDLNKAREVATKESKKLFILFTAPDSETATYIQNEVLADPKVASLAGGKYVLVRLDLEQNRQLASSIGIFKAGVVAIYAADGKPLAMVKQRLSVAEWAAKLDSL